MRLGFSSKSINDHFASMRHGQFDCKVLAPCPETVRAMHSAADQPRLSMREMINQYSSISTEIRDCLGEKYSINTMGA
jgi:hypothetical protein